MYLYEAIFALLFLVGIIICIKGIKHKMNNLFFKIAIFYFIINFVIYSFKFVYLLFENEIIYFAEQSGITVGGLVSLMVNLQFFLHVIAIIFLLFACVKQYMKSPK